MYLPNASSTVLASKICCSAHLDSLYVTAHKYCNMNLVVSVCRIKKDNNILYIS